MQHASLPESNLGLSEGENETCPCDDHACAPLLCISANKQCDAVRSGCVITAKSVHYTYLIIRMWHRLSWLLPPLHPSTLLH